MARPRKPSALLEISGAFDHDPQRRRLNEPQDSRSIGDPPERLPAEAVTFWDELVEFCAPGVLKISDRWAVELAARLMAKAAAPNAAQLLADATASGLTGGDLKAFLSRDRISAVELSILRSLLSSLGMTPSDRSKITVPVEAPKNAFADLAAEADDIHERLN